MNGFAPFFRNSIVHNCPFFVDNCLIPVFLHIVNLKLSNEDSVLELFVALGYAAFARCCSSSLSAYLFHIHPEQALVHLDAVLQTPPLVEGVE